MTGITVMPPETEGLLEVGTPAAPMTVIMLMMVLAYTVVASSRRNRLR